MEVIVMVPREEAEENTDSHPEHCPLPTGLPRLMPVRYEESLPKWEPLWDIPEAPHEN